jgi:uncharacterized membrane-anchored protein YhcB (DUF1043 family)
MMGIIYELVPWLTHFVLLLIGFIVGAFLVPYLRERGKNLATKKDIESLTDTVERIRSDYKKEEHRYQLTSAGLLKRRAEVIEQLYKMIVDIEEAFQLVVDFAEWEHRPKDELRKQAGALLYEFMREYKKSRIYFSDGLCEKLQGFEKLIFKKSMPYSIALTSKLKGNEAKDFTETWVTANEAFQTQIPLARQAIETEFRGLLGVNET